MCALLGSVLLTACSAAVGDNPDQQIASGASDGPAVGVSEGGDSQLPKVDTPTVLAGIGTAFCDGSSAIRLGMWSGGGFIGGFMRPFGSEFAFVHGDCTYVASAHPAEGIATGVLDTARVEELARDIAYAKIPDFSAHVDEVCFESEPSMISDGKAAFGCGCGCDPSKPAELVAAEAASHRWIKRLAADAPDKVDAVRAVALIDEDALYADAPAWPLARPITDFLESTQTLGSTDVGAVVDVATDVEALRALRAVAHARGTGIYVVVGGTQQYSLEVRDELPATIDAAARAFRDASTR